MWCAAVLDWDTLMEHPQFRLLDVLQIVERGSGTSYQTTTCPIRIDGHKPTSQLGSCTIGEHNRQIDEAFDL